MSDFEKIFPDNSKIIIDNGVIALYRPNKTQVSNSGVDYYFDEGRGYGCKTHEEAADKYHEIFEVYI